MTRDEVAHVLRAARALTNEEEFVNTVFLALVERLDPSFKKLMAMDPVISGAFPKDVCNKGVYLFSEFGRHFYVGRSNGIRRRYRLHCTSGAQHNTATFAFRLAREATGNIQASYRQGPGSRLGLIENPEFAAAFEGAKQRIRQMEFRFVEEVHPTVQCLLEIYVATALAAPYNDFDNH